MEMNEPMPNDGGINSSIDDFCIVLTSTIYVNLCKYHVYITDPHERLNTYLHSIKQWLDKSNFKIVLIDNSGYTFPELNDYIDKYNDRFEIVSFVEKDLDMDVFAKAGALDLTSSKHHLYTSKGTSEMFAIYYGCQKSELIRNSKSKFVIKITGRYFVNELENFLKHVNPDDYCALRQNDPDKCEMIGCHVNVFSDMFMPANYISNDGLGGHHHIENLYKYRLTTFPEEQVLVCDTFQIEPTQIGGGCDIKTQL